MIDKKTIAKIQRGEFKEEFKDIISIGENTASRPITNETLSRVRSKNAQKFLKAIKDYCNKHGDIFSKGDIISESKMHREIINRCFSAFQSLNMFIRIEKEEAKKILKELNKEGKNNKDYNDNEIYYTLNLDNPLLPSAAKVFYK